MFKKYIKLLLIMLLVIPSCNKNEHTSKTEQIIQIKPKGEVDSNGNKIGEWTFYYPTGEIKKKGSYQNGEKEGKWTAYHKNQKVRYVEEYQNNLENGKWLSFDEKGELQAKGFYKNGLKDGKWITLFHDNGQVHIEEFFSEGKNIGSTNVYYPDGKLLESTFYTNYNYYENFNPHAELDMMAKLAESMGIYNHNVDAYHRAIDAGDRGDIDSFIKALYDIDPTLDLDY